MTYQVGDYILLTGDREATVKFVGTVEFAAGEWVGCELKKGVGKHDGIVKGKRYFKTGFKKGAFVQSNKVLKLIRAGAADSGADSKAGGASSALKRFAARKNSPAAKLARAARAGNSGSRPASSRTSRTPARRRGASASPESSPTPIARKAAGGLAGRLKGKKKGWGALKGGGGAMKLKMVSRMAAAGADHAITGGQSTRDRRAGRGGRAGGYADRSPSRVESRRSMVETPRRDREDTEVSQDVAFWRKTQITDWAKRVVPRSATKLLQLCYTGGQLKNVDGRTLKEGGIRSLTERKKILREIEKLTKKSEELEKARIERATPRTKAKLTTQNTFDPDDAYDAQIPEQAVFDPSADSCSHWRKKEVIKWLNENVPKYARQIKRVVHNGDDLLALDHTILKREVRVNQTSHRNAIMRKIKQLKQKEQEIKDAITRNAEESIQRLEEERVKTEMDEEAQKHDGQMERREEENEKQAREEEEARKFQEKEKALEKQRDEERLKEMKKILEDKAKIENEMEKRDADHKIAFVKQAADKDAALLETKFSQEKERLASELKNEQKAASKARTELQGKSTQIETLMESIDERDERISSLEADVQTANDERQKAKTESDQEVNTLRAERENLRTQLNDTKSMLSEKGGTEGANKQRIMELQTDKTGLSNELAKVRESLNGAERTRVNLEGQLDQRKAAYSEKLANMEREKQIAVDKSSRQEAEATRKLKKMTDQYSTAEARAKAARKEIETLNEMQSKTSEFSKDQAQQMEQRIEKEKKVLREEFEARNRTMESAKEELQQRLDSQARQYEQQQTFQKSSFDQAMQMSKTQKESQEKQMKRETDRYEQMIDKNTKRFDKQMDDMQNRLTESDNNHRRKRDELEGQLDVKNSEYKSLQDEFEEAQHDAEASLKMMQVKGGSEAKRMFEEQLSKVRADKDVVDEQLGTYKAKDVENKARIKSLEREMQDKATQMQKLTKEATSSRGKARDHEMETVQLNNKIKRLEGDMQSGQKEVKDEKRRHERELRDTKRRQDIKDQEKQLQWDRQKAELERSHKDALREAQASASADSELSDKLAEHKRDLRLEKLSRERDTADAKRRLEQVTQSYKDQLREANDNVSAALEERDEIVAEKADLEAKFAKQKMALSKTAGNFGKLRKQVNGIKAEQEKEKKQSDKNKKKLGREIVNKDRELQKQMSLLKVEQGRAAKLAKEYRSSQTELSTLKREMEESGGGGGGDVQLLKRQLRELRVRAQKSDDKAKSVQDNFETDKRDWKKQLDRLEKEKMDLMRRLKGKKRNSLDLTNDPKNQRNTSTKWWYLSSNNNPKGPISEQDLKKKLAQGSITQIHGVRNNANLKIWTPIVLVPNLLRKLRVTQSFFPYAFFGIPSEYIDDPNSFYTMVKRYKPKNTHVMGGHLVVTFKAQLKRDDITYLIDDLNTLLTPDDPSQQMDVDIKAADSRVLTELMEPPDKVKRNRTNESKRFAFDDDRSSGSSDRYSVKRQGSNGYGGGRI